MDDLRLHPGLATARIGVAVAALTALLLVPPAGSSSHGMDDKVAGDPPTVGEEIAFDQTLTSLLRHQSGAVAASNGQDFLVAWVDDDHSLRGAVITPDGGLSDPHGVLIEYGRFPYGVDIAWTGEHFFVVWKSGFNTIRGARVASDGSLLDPTPVTIVRRKSLFGGVEVASTDSTSLVVWTESNKGTSLDLGASSISVDGEVEEKSHLRLPGPQYNAAVEAVGDTLLVAWSGGGFGRDSNIRGAVLSDQTSLIDAKPFVITSARRRQRKVQLSQDGTQFLAVWEDYRRRNATGVDVFGARIAPEGEVLDERGLAIATSQGPQHSPVVGAVQGEFLVGWRDRPSRQMDGAVVGGDGVVAGAELFPRRNLEAIAGATDRYAVVWTAEHGGGYSTIEAGLVDRTGTPISAEPTVVSYALQGQESPNATWNGSNYLVSWNSFSGHQEIRAALVSATGEVTGPLGTALFTKASIPRHRAVATDGRDFLVVHQQGAIDDFGDVYAARVTSDGTLLDPAGIPVEVGRRLGAFPMVAASETFYLVVWQQLLGRKEGSRAKRVTSDGTVADSEAITLGGKGVFVSDVASNGTGWMLVDAHRTQAGRTIRAREMDTTGRVERSTSIAVAEGRLTSFPVLEGNGETYFVAWANGGKVVGARLNENGAPLDAAPIEIGTGWADLSVAPDADGFLVIWRKRQREGHVNVGLARIGPEGIVTERHLIRLPSNDFVSNFVAVAGEGGQVALLYERLAPEYPFNGSHRVFLRLIDVGESD